MGVITSQNISVGTFVTEYKYGKIHHTRKEKERAELDHIKNGERACYILEVYLDGKRKYLDATRRYRTYGRCAYSIMLSCSDDLACVFSATGISTTLKVQWPI